MSPLRPFFEVVLLVSIVIFLGAVLFSTIGSVRAHAADDAVKTNLLAIQRESRVFLLFNSRYSTDGLSSFRGKCPTDGSTLFAEDTVIKNAVHSALDAIGGNYTQDIRCGVGSEGSSFAVAVRLKTEDAWWCVDGGGASKRVAGITAPSITDGTDARCP